MKYLKRRGPDAKERRQMQRIIGIVVPSKKCCLLFVAMWIGTVFFSSPNLQAAEVWDKVFSEPYTETSGHNPIRAMAEFQGTLYVVAGRSSQVIPHPGRVYRLVSISAGSGIWDNVTPPWSEEAGDGSMAMFVYDNRLYVGNGIGEIFCTHDGTTWIPVTANLLPKYEGSSINCPDMAEFNGQLYIVRGS